MPLGKSIAEVEKALLERAEWTRCLKLSPDHMYHISMNYILSARFLRNLYYNHPQKAFMKIKDYHAH